jgi:hypothetical protein
VRVYTTAPMEDPRDARRVFPRLEEIGYDGAFSFEAKQDPFLPLVLAAEHTKRLQLRRWHARSRRSVFAQRSRSSTPAICGRPSRSSTRG